MLRRNAKIGHEVASFRTGWLGDDLEMTHSQEIIWRKKRIKAICLREKAKDPILNILKLSKLIWRQVRISL
jgi:hypothetical protein